MKVFHRSLCGAVLVCLMGLVGNGGVEAQEAGRERIEPSHSDLGYGEHGRQVLDLYRAWRHEPTPLVLYIHGGGFRGGDKRSISQGRLKSFLREGWSVAALNYRLTDTAPMPAAYLDCARALQFLRHHADQWNLDPRLVASTGGSAGAGIERATVSQTKPDIAITFEEYTNKDGSGWHAIAAVENRSPDTLHLSRVKKGMWSCLFTSPSRIRRDSPSSWSLDTKKPMLRSMTTPLPSCNRNKYEKS